MYIAAGVRTDCEKLIEEFIRYQSLRFKKFAEIWQCMKFSAIFLGRQTAKEMLEFIEECEQIALSFCLPPCNFQVQVGGLYLLYSLFVTQPTNMTTKIRITIPQWRELMNYVIQGNHHDMHLVFRKLQALNAFYFVATGIVMGPDLRDVPSDDSVTLKYREQKSSLSDLIDKDSIEQLTAIHQHYYKMKCTLAGPNATRPEKSIDVIPSCLAPVMVKCVEEFEKVKDQKPPKGDSATSGKKYLDPDWEPLAKSKASKKMQIFSRKAKVSRARIHREPLNLEDSPTKTPSAQQTKKSAAKKKEAITAEKVLEEDETQALIINKETALDMPILVSKSFVTNKQKDIVKKTKNVSKIISNERPKKKRKVMTNETSKINQEDVANIENTNAVSTQKDVNSPNV